ncbi:hypothetical protein LXA43DRAFT_1096268 [Ganoderma leucocontextum]|nr:hypothetical protein LXA43DRAFT_1096254 [Ganoderma leucocontextum]KAI1789530.1 hypothetical protein LXA43DRAFT_1096268 [Ganoderma leucocontextum]
MRNVVTQPDDCGDVTMTTPFDGSMFTTGRHPKRPWHPPAQGLPTTGSRYKKVSFLQVKAPSSWTSSLTVPLYNTFHAEIYTLVFTAFTSYMHGIIVYPTPFTQYATARNKLLKPGEVVGFRRPADRCPLTLTVRISQTLQQVFPFLETAVVLLTDVFLSI